MHISMCLHGSVYMCNVCMSLYMHACLHGYECVLVLVCVCVYVCVYDCLCFCMYIYVCMCVCLCVHMDGFISQKYYAFFYFLNFLSEKFRQCTNVRHSKVYTSASTFSSTFTLLYLLYLLDLLVNLFLII